MIKLIELLNEDEIEEYDVENADDIKEFIEFMESYQQELNESVKETERIRNYGR